MSSTKNKVLAVIFCIAFLLSVLAFVVSGNNSAQAIQTAHFKGTDIIGFVDETTGNVTFSDGAITNIGNKNAVIEQVITKRPDGIDDGNCTWTLKSGDVSLFNGITSTQGTTTILEQELDVLVGSSIPLSVSVDGLGADKAKSLIEKNVISLSFKLKEKTSEVSVTGVKLDQSCLNLELGSSTKLNETVEPENATNKSVLWSSSDDKVASVNDNGIVTANAEGQANVVVTTNDGGYKDTCTVTVQNKQIKVKTYAEQNLTYTGYAQKLGYVIPDVEDCEILYTVDGTSVAGEPKATNAEVHKVGYKVSKTGYITAEGSFDVLIAKAKVDVPTAEVGLVYNTKEQVGVKVSEGETRYTLSNASATNAGDYCATATLKDKENYVWNIENPSSEDQHIDWNIDKKTLNGSEILGIKPSYEYTGEVIHPVPTKVITDDGLTVTSDSYTVKYPTEEGDYKEPGTYEIEVCANTDSNFNDSVSQAFLIMEMKNNLNISSIDDKTYKAKDITPDFTVTDQKGNILDSDKYSTIYVNNKNAGIAQVAVTGLDEYLGCYGISSFTINKKELTVNGVSVADKEYDGTKAATIEDEGNLEGVISPDIVSVESATASFTDPNVGKDKPVSFNYVISQEANNYVVKNPTDIVASINPAKVDVPVAETGLVYNEKEQIGVKLPEGEARYTLSNASEKNAGNYTATAKLKDKENYVWNIKNPTSENQNIPWTIEKKDATLTLNPVSANYTVPTAKAFTYTYVGDGDVSASSSDKNVVTTSLDILANTVTVTPVAKGQATITVSATEGKNYNLVSATHKAAIEAGSIIVNQHSAEVQTYTGNPLNLGYVSTEPDDCTIEYSVDGVKTEGNPTATDAGDHIVTYKVTKTGYNDVVGTFSSTINPVKVDVPQAEVGLVYNAKEQTGVKLPEGETRYTLSNASATNAGKYTAKAKLVDTKNYVWDISNPTSSDQSIDWNINQKTLYGGNMEGILVSYEYNGEVQQPKPTKVTTDNGLTVSSDSYTVKYPTEGDYKEPGNYEVEVCANTDSNFKDSVSQAFLIVKQEESLTIDSIKDQTYNGSEINPDITVKDKSSGTVLQPNQYSKFYINNKNVGTAQVVVLGTKESYIGKYAVGEFTINKKELTISDVKVSDKFYDGTKAATIENIGKLEGVISPDVVSIESATASFLDSNAGQNKQVNLNYVISQEANNYEVKNPTYVVASINPVKVDVPKAETGLVYNTKEQVGVKVLEDETRYKVSDNVKTEAGDYNAIAILTDKTNYVWNIENPSPNDQIIPWTIKKKDATLTLNPVSSNYTVPTAKAFTYTYVGDGDVSASSSDKNVATTSLDMLANIVTVTPVAKGQATITVSATEGKNYNLVSATHRAAVEAGSITVSKYPAEDLTYTGSPLKLGYVSPEPQDCTIKYIVDGKAVEGVPTAIEAGDHVVTYKVTKAGYNEETGSFIATIKPAKVNVPQAKTGLVYNAEEQTGVRLPEGETRYTLTNESATNAGSYSATATLADKSNYVWDIDTPSSDDQKISWEITQKDISACTVEEIKASTYTGHEIEPILTVKDRDQTLVQDKDFSVSYINNVNAAESTSANPPTAQIEGIANYKGNIDKTFNINKAKNPMTFVLNPNSFESVYSDSLDASATILGVDSIPDGYKVTYSLNSPVAGFDIPNAEKNILQCNKGTLVGSYNLSIKATCSYDVTYKPENWETGDISQAAVWTVKEKVNYNPIVKEVNSTKVTFLPSYDANVCPYRFYKKVGNAYIEIKDIGNMEDLAKKINSAGADNVYTDATGVTFYGTIEKGWYDAFTSTSKKGVASGLNSGFKSALDEAGVKTVYGDYVDGVWVSDASCNWDAHAMSSSDIEPKLDTLGYNSFQKSYASLLSENSAKPWSSRLSNNTFLSYHWKCSSGSWVSDHITRNHGVVLSLVFTKDISLCTIDPIADTTYTGSEITPELTVKDGTKTLVKDKDYIVTYMNNINAGDSTSANPPSVIIKGKGNYEGSITKTFTIKKAKNPMTFDLDPSSFLSAYSDTNDVFSTIVSVDNVPDGYKITYSLDPEVAGFEIPNQDTNVIECNKGTVIGSYDLTIKATCSYCDTSKPQNWESGNISQNAVWTIMSASYYKPIQRTVGDEIVNFMPAYNESICPYNFYKKSGDIYFKIEGITDMNSLASKVITEGAENVYTDAQNTTFYGTIDKAWNDVFDQNTISGVSKGLNTAFKEVLNNAGIKTEYFDTNESTTAKTTGNWSMEEPYRWTTYFGTGDNAVIYDNFYNAYNTLLSPEAVWAWTSKAMDSEDAYYREVKVGGWGVRGRIYPCGVALSWDIKKDISMCTIDPIADTTYTGSEITPELTIKDKGIALTKDKDYKVSYKNNVNAADSTSANSPTAMIEGIGDYEGSINKTFTIKKAKNPMTFDLNPNSFTSTYSNTDDEREHIWGVENVPSGYNVTYSVDPVVPGFEIPNEDENILQCNKGTDVGKYNLIIKATCSYDNTSQPENWESGNASQNAVWTVKEKIKKPIQRVVNGVEVTFLPAVSDAQWSEANMKFYEKKDDGTFKELTDVTSMSTLVKSIENIDPSKPVKINAAKVYVDEMDAKFYGTFNSKWDSAFEPTTLAGDASGLNQDFKKILDNAGVKTVYGNYQEGTWVKDSTGNWDAHDMSSSDKEPKLGSVGYNTFYKEYSSLLSEQASTPWSSCAEDKNRAFHWSYYSSPSEWSFNGRGVECSVVLSLALGKDISTCTVDSIEDATFTGSEVTPKLTVKDGDRILVEEEDYTVSYSNNINAADSTSKNPPTATVQGIGSYEGSIDRTFTIKKAQNPMEFILDPSNFSSVYSNTWDSSSELQGVNNIPAGYKVAYSLEQAVPGFEIPNENENVLQCNKGTDVGTYNLIIKATCSYDSTTEEPENWLSGDISQTAIWTVYAKEKRPIQRTVNTHKVIFLPAVADKLWSKAGIKFYEKKSDGSYKELTEITSMATLVTAIRNIDTTKSAKDNAAKVYTDDSNATFYGTIDYKWNDVFDPNTIEGDALGLDSTFKAILDRVGAKTVYGDYDTQGKWIKDSTCNWDAHYMLSTDKQPKLGTLNYDLFQQAYSSLLSSGSNYALSSKAVDSSRAYGWLTGSKWDDLSRSEIYSAVLSLPFGKDISTCSIDPIYDATYTGSEITPEPTIRDGASILVKDKDYKVSYKNNVNAANSTSENPPTVTVKGIGNYEGSIDKTFTIKKAKNPMTFVLDPRSFVSAYSDTDDASAQILGVDNVPEGYKVTYSLNSSVAGFEIPNKDTNILKCNKGTESGSYSISIKATCTYNDTSRANNWETGSVSQEAIWTINETGTYKLIQCKVGSDIVTFLPAYNEEYCPYNFYIKNEGNIYIELEDVIGMSIRDMDSLVTAIQLIDTSKTPLENASKVYTDATDAKFYGTIDRAWSDAFDNNTESGDALGLNSVFKATLDTAGVKTVYGDYDNDGKWQKDSTANWDAHDMSSTSQTPKLGPITYYNFKKAYKSLLSSGCSDAWSSQAKDKENAYCWDSTHIWWYDCNRNTDETAVVLCQYFSKDISTCTVDPIADTTYTGSEITPELTIKDGDTNLVKDKDYTVSYINNVDAADSTSVSPPTAVVKGIGNYKGSIEKTFTINKAKNPMTFVLIPNNFESVYSDTNDTSSFILGVNNVPDGYKVSYSLDQPVAGFEIPNQDENVLICKKCTVAGNYNMTIKVSCSYNDTSKPQNWESGEVLQSATWKVKVYKPIQRKVGSDLVTFLPAYSGDNPGCKFYEKEGDNYTEIGDDDITDMESLAQAIVSVGVEKVYTDATDTKFYGMINQTWDNTFDANTIKGDALGLNSDFKATLDTAGVKTAYGDYDTQGKWIKDSSNNWDFHDFSAPKLGSVDYKEFCSAYWSVYKNYPDHPLSSKAVNSISAYCWFDNVDPQHWDSVSRSDENISNVVLTLPLEKQHISICTIDPIADTTYTGSEITPELTIKYGSTTLIENKDYKVSYTNNVNAASSSGVNPPTVKITGIGNYVGSISKTFNINKAENPMTFTLDPSSFRSVYSDTEDQSRTLLGVNNIPEGYKVTYSLEQAVEGFEIPNPNENILKCSKSTLGGRYDLMIKATCSYNDSSKLQNWETGVVSQSAVWTINQNPNYKPIQRTVNNVVVNFLPAYFGKDPGCMFFIKKGETYSQIKEITDMASLSSAISKVGASNIYTDAESTPDQSIKFYGTISQEWDKTFDASTVVGDALGLNSDFRKVIDEAGVKSVYGDYDKDNKWIKNSIGNWDAHDIKSTDQETKLGSVGYPAFYEAYKDLLSKYANIALSSRAFDSTYCYTWGETVQWGWYWQEGRPRNYKHTAVLYLTF